VLALESFDLAYRMRTSAPEVFDVGREPQHVQKAYGLDRKESKDYGRQCLIACRLVERGVRFVQIFASCPNTPGGAVIHATVLHLLGLDHTKLTYRFNGRDFRLTDVAGTVLRHVLA
jgi:Protein of unknown function (DUF1501)